MAVHDAVSVASESWHEGTHNEIGMTGRKKLELLTVIDSLV